MYIPDQLVTSYFWVFPSVTSCFFKYQKWLYVFISFPNVTLMSPPLTTTSHHHPFLQQHSRTSMAPSLRNYFNLQRHQLIEPYIFFPKSILKLRTLKSETHIPKNFETKAWWCAKGCVMQKEWCVGAKGVVAVQNWWSCEVVVVRSGWWSGGDVGWVLLR